MDILTNEEVRIIDSLIENEFTTPEYYSFPSTLSLIPVIKKPVETC
ncbi:MAG: hypothetical protein AB1394_11780 [Bacteroidota bacterium]